MGGEEEGWGGGWPPAPSGAPLYLQRDEHWTHFDNSVNAVSFGFVATAILISMFLVMAIFEKFLRTASPSISPSGGRNRRSDVEAQNRMDGFNSKLGCPSPKFLGFWHTRHTPLAYDIWKKGPIYGVVGRLTGPYFH